MKRPLVLVLSLFAFAGSQAEVLLQENFSDADPTRQALPQSAAWLKIANSVATLKTTTLEISNGALVLTPDPAATQAQTLAYFADAPVDLAVGESLVLSFTFLSSAPGSLNHGLRFGIFNSGEKRVTKEGFTDNSQYVGWKGYSVWTNVQGAGGGATTIRKRVGESATLFDGAQGVFVTLPNSGAGLGLAPVTPAKGILKITRTREDEVSIHFSLNGIDLTSADSTGTCHEFDTIVFRAAPTAVGSFSLSEISVERSK